MDDTKQILVQNIQTWLKIDNEMKTLRKELRDRRHKKKMITSILVDIMKKNQIDDVALKNEKLLYTKTKVKTPLSKKHLYSSIASYFKSNPDLAKELSIYIMETRKEKINENIKRKNIK